MAGEKGLEPEVLASLKQIIQIMKEDDLSEISVERKDMKIQVKRTLDHPVAAMQGMSMLATSEKAAPPSDADDANTSDGLSVISAPMVGTFYGSPSPEAEQFVNVGDEIAVDQVICVIDAMKLMNEITADVSGEIVEILLEDGQQVEFDQPMFRVRPK